MLQASSTEKPVLRTNLKSRQLSHRGKARDLYPIGTDKLLLVQTDRLSAFDVILDDPIPGKGEVLTSLCFWFAKYRHIVPNHMTDISPKSVVAPEEHSQVEGRSMVVKRQTPLLVEAIVRGYIIGSGWKDYQETGEICGIALPSGLQQAQKLPQPIFTPSNKAPVGEHDTNITFDRMAEIINNYGLAKQIKEVSLRLYSEAAEYAATRGIIIADTKFEFGVDQNGHLVLIDEALTPDSSRFWPADQYQVGMSPPSFDKQFVRDWLETQAWDKKAPAPRLPPEVIQQTTEKYREAARLLITR